MIACGKWEVQRTVNTVLQMSPRAGLLEQNADTALNVWVSRALAVIEIIETLPVVVETTNVI